MFFEMRGIIYQHLLKSVLIERSGWLEILCDGCWDCHDLTLSNLAMTEPLCGSKDKHTLPHAGHRGISLRSTKRPLDRGEKRSAQMRSSSMLVSIHSVSQSTRWPVLGGWADANTRWQGTQKMWVVNTARGRRKRWIPAFAGMTDKARRNLFPVGRRP